MPLMPRLGSGIPLVARGRELRRLRAAVDAAGTGRAAAVLLAGDAGVGKTRMTEEVGAYAREQGALVLTGRCLDAGETGLPYLPVAEALAQVRELGVEPAQVRPALGRLFPDVALPTGPDPGRLASGMAIPVVGPRSEQDIGQLQLFDAVHGLLTDLAEQRPVVLVLEDLHWADGSTRSLLSFLFSRLRSQRLVVLGTYRSDDLHRRHPLRPLLAELVRLPQVERIELAPFGTADARAFVTALAEDLITEPVLREVAGRSEGNAFFAEELLAAYSECGAGIPATLVDVLLARVERLSPATQNVVRVASVAGRRVPHARLRAVADLSDTDLEAALRDAVAHHVLVPDDGDLYTFRHALLREAVYGDLLPGERVRLHAAYARELAADTGTRGIAAALAHHSMESHALPAALTASVDAAWEAERLGAPAESLEHLERALKLWDAVPEAERPGDLDELTLLRRASWVAGMSGDPERAIAFARSAVKLADETVSPERAAKLRRRLAQALYAVDGREEESRQNIEQAWELVAERPASADQAWVLAAYATILRGHDRMAESREHAERAVTIARSVGASGPEADALITLAILAESDNQGAESREWLVEARDRARDVEAITVELRATYSLCVSFYEAGLLAEAAAVAAEGVARAGATGLTWSTYGLELRVVQVVILYAKGDWDGSEAAAEPPGHKVSSTVSARLAVVGAHVAVGRGRFAEADRLVTELRSDWHRDLQIPLVAGGVGAELAAWRGRPERAVECVREALDWVAQAGEQWVMAGIRMAALGIAAHADLAVAARRTAHGPEDAVEEGGKLVALARKTAEFGSPRTGELGPEGRAWLARAEAEYTRLTGDSDAARWRTAVAAFDYGALYEQAVCRRRLAEALLADDDREAAAVELRAAERVATRLDAKPLLDALRKAARRGRIPLDEATVIRDEVDPFTPRERAVLGLVALGRTNRQVGEELFISEKTVSVHLSRIMAKLGASRRAEAVAVAYDRGLLTEGSAGPVDRR
ncbi:helix-turn-helix transcriptional regulator [Actinokineospora sp. NBRC 105648]|uniref:helix-turn-helix transcriptional regulator n=1 Tax=Actinokineospora sp. NBRC 105648 TaxID=3032206 RepID=UPI00249FC760|nr:helix-turn-helix transcriptional regulator [Actinokineospora sp. NBRC 105648]GLZ39445.1 LuxR family transcriptional regulator [Actinokineospora sp. NBRC 105648]